MGDRESDCYTDHFMRTILSSLINSDKCSLIKSDKCYLLVMTVKMDPYAAGALQVHDHTLPPLRSLYADEQRFKVISYHEN